MKIKAGGGVVHGLVRRLNALGEVEIIHSLKAGRQEGKCVRKKAMSGPAETRKELWASSSISLVYWRRKEHKIDRHTINLRLQDLVANGGHKEDISLDDLQLQPVILRVQTEDVGKTARWSHKVAKCRAVVVGSNGEPNYIY
ncbi:MAG: hypothetical protein WCO10_03040 [bacterium]